MKRNMITADEDMPLEEAARIMADHKIGSLPVLRGGELVGIITETDVFKVFLELLGARETGVRVTALVKEEPGKLHQLTGAIQAVKGNIIALGTFLGESSENRMVTLKVSGVDAARLRQAIEPLVEKVVDIRETVAV
jgi:acetoin utilization protein AcuB